MGNDQSTGTGGGGTTDGGGTNNGGTGPLPGGVGNGNGDAQTSSGGHENDGGSSQALEVKPKFGSSILKKPYTVKSEKSHRRMGNDQSTGTGGGGTTDGGGTNNGGTGPLPGGVGNGNGDAQTSSGGHENDGGSSQALEVKPKFGSSILKKP
eukprot:CAMPEP_0113887732 /NCGR_PEP_ID=MMETSP0780_2-20120614/12406_1 /TAXON_ID=652834 /ORGANISM="Palpitomonas bilix" /LENGTH=151 /DNA_ID=CAMNT_0000876355 /DNA_START=70 /DNA_END=527 /DNA_ORIENTATION=+ /assembly_acc=CAM_ASM_000599